MNEVQWLKLGMVLVSVILFEILTYHTYRPRIIKDPSGRKLYKLDYKNRVIVWYPFDYSTYPYGVIVQRDARKRPLWTEEGIYFDGTTHLKSKDSQTNHIVPDSSPVL